MQLLSFRNILIVGSAIFALFMAYAYWNNSEAGSFTGCYGGGAVGYSAALSDTSLDATGIGTVASVDSLAASGGNITALAGCDVQVGKSPLVLVASHHRVRDMHFDAETFDIAL